MKTFSAICLLFLVPKLLLADEILPSASREEMGEYKNAFGKAVAESRQQDRKIEEDKARKRDTFGQQVSDAARTMKTEIQTEQKNFGAWVSKQRRDQDKGEGKNERGASDARSRATRHHSSQEGKGGGLSKSEERK
jgi:hypothetical protein